MTQISWLTLLHLIYIVHLGIVTFAAETCLNVIWIGLFTQPSRAGFIMLVRDDACVT